MINCALSALTSERFCWVRFGEAHGSRRRNVEVALRGTVRSGSDLGFKHLRFLRLLPTPPRTFRGGALRRVADRMLVATASVIFSCWSRPRAESCVYRLECR